MSYPAGAVIEQFSNIHQVIGPIRAGVKKGVNPIAGRAIPGAVIIGNVGGTINAAAPGARGMPGTPGNPGTPGTPGTPPTGNNGVGGTAMAAGKAAPTAGTPRTGVARGVIVIPGMPGTPGIPGIPTPTNGVGTKGVGGTAMAAGNAAPIGVRPGAAGTPATPPIVGKVGVGTRPTKLEAKNGPPMPVVAQRGAPIPVRSQLGTPVVAPDKKAVTHVGGSCAMPFVEIMPKKATITKLINKTLKNLISI